jgi:hypothetical protein
VPAINGYPDHISGQRQIPLLDVLQKAPAAMRSRAIFLLSLYTGIAIEKIHTHLNIANRQNVLLKFYPAMQFFTR